MSLPPRAARGAIVRHYPRVKGDPHEFLWERPPCGGVAGFLQGSQGALTRLAHPARDTQYPNFRALMTTPRLNPELPDCPLAREVIPRRTPSRCGS
jgi:hypothetical protein